MLICVPIFASNACNLIIKVAIAVKSKQFRFVHAGQNMVSMKCAGINGTGPARTHMAMNLQTTTLTDSCNLSSSFNCLVVFCHLLCHMPYYVYSIIRLKI